MAKAKQPQHLVALANANRIRLARAEIKRRVADGTLAASDVVRDPPDCLTSMPVVDLLRCQSRWGYQRSRRVLSELLVHERRPLGNLTDRQREVVATALAEHEAAAAARRAKAANRGKT